MKLYLTFLFCFSVALLSFSQSDIKREFLEMLERSKTQFKSEEYMIIFRQNTYVYDRQKPYESFVQQFSRKGSSYAHKAPEFEILNLPEYRIVVDSTDKIIYITDTEAYQEPVNFFVKEEFLEKIRIEKKMSGSSVVYNVDVFSLNMEFETIQYYFDKESNVLQKIIFFYKEGEYYEDENHLNEKESPVQEIIIEKISFGKTAFPLKEKYISVTKNSFSVAAGYKGFELSDVRQKK